MNGMKIAVVGACGRMGRMLIEAVLKDGQITELIVGKDEHGEIAIFEVEKGQGGEL